MAETSNINIGVINPYALTEVVLKKKINWERIANPHKLLEQALKMPYEKMFDPKHGSPLYAGMKYDPKTNSVSYPVDVSTGIGALKEHVEAMDNMTWVNTAGEFFVNGAEVTDPIQGAVADCYFIAALSSLAWADTYVIADKSAYIGGKVYYEFDFYDGGVCKKVEITSLLPMSSNLFIYARSSENGELWPALYEKAFAKWSTKDASDEPDITKIAFGDPVRALATLTNLPPNYRTNSSLSADDIWKTVRENSTGSKTFNPMVAWTYGTAPSPDVNYNSAHLVANHSYSILGWASANNQNYIVLRNPWGTYEATLNTANITWVAWNEPYYNDPNGTWLSIPMATNDGIFALRADIFQKYFAGFGWVKTSGSP